MGTIGIVLLNLGLRHIDYLFAETLPGLFGQKSTEVVSLVLRGRVDFNIQGDSGGVGNNPCESLQYRSCKFAVERVEFKIQGDSGGVVNNPCESLQVQISRWKSSKDCPRGYIGDRSFSSLRVFRLLALRLLLKYEFESLCV